MTIFTDMLDNVYVLTNRPDLVAETKSQIKKAAIKLHGADFFKADLKEVVVPVTAAVDFRYTLDLTDTAHFTRRRKVHYVRQYETPPTGRERDYKMYDAADILDDYSLEGTNYSYQAGLVVNVISFAALTNVRVGYFQFPDTSETTFSSWIASLSTSYLEEEAAKNIFKIIGKDEEFQKYETICADNLAAIKMAGI